MATTLMQKGTVLQRLIGSKCCSRQRTDLLVKLFKITHK